MDEGAFMRNFRDLYDCCSNRKGKTTDWLNLVVMAHLSTIRKYLQFLVQGIQVVIFTFAHYFILFLIPCIFFYLQAESNFNGYIGNFTSLSSGLLAI